MFQISSRQWRYPVWPDSIVAGAQVAALVVQTVIAFVAVWSIWPKKTKVIVYLTHGNMTDPHRMRHEWHLVVRNLGPRGITDVKVSELPKGNSWFDKFPKKDRVLSWGESYLDVGGCFLIPLGNIADEDTEAIKNGELPPAFKWIDHLKVQYRTSHGRLVTERMSVSFGPVSQKMKWFKGI